MDKAIWLDRLALWRELLSGPWKWMVTVPFAVISAFAFVRDEFLSAESQERLKLPHRVPDWHWQTWALITVTLFLLGTLESAYRIVSAARASKSPQARDELGAAYQDGMRIFKEKLQDAAAYPDWRDRLIAWGESTATLIEQYLGKADRHLFENPDPGLAGVFNGAVDKVHNTALCNANARLKVLRELLSRPSIQ